jgi:hypothetical protein
MMIGGIEKEISPELAEALLNTEGLRLQICKARDHSFADVFGVLDKNLKHSRELKFIDFRPSDDVSAGDMLLVPDVGELRVTSVETQLDDGKTVCAACLCKLSANDCRFPGRITPLSPHPATGAESLLCFLPHWCRQSSQPPGPRLYLPEEHQVP